MEEIKKKVLICGSTGFIGRNLAEAFACDEGLEVYGTYFKSRPLEDARIKSVKADLTSREDVDRAIKGMDIIIQAAATTTGSKDTFTRPYYHVTDNAVMNALIFKAVHDHDAAHLIFLSCTTMYQSSDSPIKEADFDPGDEMYPKYFGGAWTKVYNEKMCEFYSRLGRAKYTVIRHSNIYGPYDKYDLEKSHVFGATITKVLDADNGSDIVVWGTGEEERDLLHVSDLVEAIRLTIYKQESKFELFNAGYGDSISVKDLVAKIIHHSGKRLGTRHDTTKPAIKTRICLDTAKARALLGWQPKISLDDGIKMTLEWCRNNINDSVLERH